MRWYLLWLAALCCALVLLLSQPLPVDAAPPAQGQQQGTLTFGGEPVYTMGEPVCAQYFWGKVGIDTMPVFQPYGSSEKWIIEPYIYGSLVDAGRLPPEYGYAILQKYHIDESGFFWLDDYIPNYDVSDVTPVSSCEPSLSFTSDADSLVKGECTTLRWDVEQVKAVYVDGGPVTGHEVRQVCPDATTTYTLGADTYVGWVERSATVIVSAPATVNNRAKQITFALPNDTVEYLRIEGKNQWGTNTVWQWAFANPQYIVALKDWWWSGALVIDFYGTQHGLGRCIIDYLNDRTPDDTVYVTYQEPGCSGEAGSAANILRPLAKTVLLYFMEEDANLLLDTADQVNSGLECLEALTQSLGRAGVASTVIRLAWGCKDWLLMEGVEDVIVRAGYQVLAEPDGSGSTRTPRSPSDNVINLTASATVRASSIYPTDQYGSYGPRQVVDGNLATAWVEGVEGEGRGEWIELDFGRSVRIQKLRISVGYDASASLFAANNRVADGWLIFSDGSYIELGFGDLRGLQDVLLAVTLGEIIETTSVRLVIDSVFPGSRYDDTAVAEIQVWGNEE